MKKFLSKTSAVWPLFFILITIILLFLRNYTSNTYLTGWDNLHSEFNFGMNINRAFFSVWQEYQGLGLLAGMAHAADLPRQIFLWLVSFVIPKDLIRYFYHFLMLLIGMVGVYKILKDLILKENEKGIKVSSLLGAVFYLLNFGTIQYFYVPFEPYSTFWGFFPWEVYCLFNYLKNPSKRNLLFLTLINLIAIPQAYVQTIFLVYLLCLFLILGIFLYKNKSLASLKRSIKILFIILAINSFWLLPNSYFTVKGLNVTQNAMQNKMATEKFFQMNKARGNISDFPLLHEFYYDFFDFDLKSGNFDYLMKSWRNYFSNPFIIVIGYSLFGIVIFGLLQRNPYRKYILSIFALCLLIFLSNTPIISFINNIFRSTPIINQIFRNPFTKFIVPTVFVFSLGFGLGIGKITELLFSRLKVKPIFIAFIFLALLIFYVFPVFKGELIAPQMRITIPKEYFDLFAYFEKQDKNARIANLPQSSLWGWNYYRFGTRGSGFLWYGIEQPIMDRAFDVWSTSSENYYWELSYALNKRDKDLFNKTLEKYQVSYIIFDNNLLLTDNINSKKANLNQEELLKNNPLVEKKNSFGKINLYKVKQKYSINNNLFVGNNLPAVSIEKEFSQKDNAFNKFGSYYSSKENNNYIFPFGSLFSKRFSNEKTFDIKEEKDRFEISSNIPSGTYYLNLPSFKNTESIIATDIYAKRDENLLTLRLILLRPSLFLDDKQILGAYESKDIEIKVPSSEKNLILDINNNEFLKINNLNQDFTPLGNTFLSNNDDANYFKIYSAKPATSSFLLPEEFEDAHICSDSQRKDSFFSGNVLGNSLVLKAKNSAACNAYKKPIIAPEDALLKVSFNYKSKSDEYPQYCLLSKNSNSCLNKKDNINFGFSESFKNFTEYFESNGRNDALYFQSVLEALSDEDKNKTKEISYANINISIFSNLFRGKIDLTNRQDFESKISIDLKNKAKLKIEIPKIQNYLTYISPIKKNIYKKESLNYDSKMPGKFSLEETEDTAKILRLKAENASSYLLLRANNLSSENGYILGLEARNKNGFPLLVNVFTNKNLRNHIFTFASKSSEFEKNYFILPPYYAFDKGIDVLMSSTSYTNIPTVNDISDIYFYPIPYNYITNIYFEKKGIEAINPKYFKIEAKKQNISFYETGGNIPVKNATLILSQAYHSGWKAYESKFKNQNSKIKNFLVLAFPFIFGTELKEHVIVNSWENGWILDKSQVENGRKIVIVYLPQYLEYAGFAMFIGFIVWIIKNIFISRVSKDLRRT